MKTLFLSPLAEADLEDILDYIAQDRPLTAERIVAEIRGTCELLRDFPQLGRARPEIGKNCRCIPVSRYVVYYRYPHERDHVYVLRILDGARDIDEISFSD